MGFRRDYQFSHCRYENHLEYLTVQKVISISQIKMTHFETIAKTTDHRVSVLLTKQMNWQNKQSALTRIVKSAIGSHHMN